MYKQVQYVIHKHEAKSSGAGTHYDLRFEIPNQKMLASYALPKAKIPGDGEKVLAVRGSDHDKKWLKIDDFTIPDDEYGAGYMSIVETGKIDILGYGPTYITFESHNKILNGRFLLVKFKGKLKSDKRDNNWIFMKIKNKNNIDNIK